MRKTKIVCTLGPASSDKATISALIDAGMDVARLNFSHSTPETHAATMKLVREAAAEAGKEVAVLQDLPGPKIRSGSGETVELEKNGEVEVVPGRDETMPGSIGCTYADLGRELAAGDRIMLSDGTLELEVLDSAPERVRARVVREGTLKPRQGMNLPGAKLGVRSPTLDDIRFLKWGLNNEVDYVALSFVQSADDLRKAREAAGERAGDLRLIAKIERPEATHDLDDILDVADGIMVARGDLGVELPPEQVPNLQREIIRSANLANKPVITATQMLESMTEHSRPTRAEVSDVAHAIWDGTDAVMLSGETASGRHPLKACAIMERIARSAEGEYTEGERAGDACRRAPHESAQDVIGLGAELLAGRLGAVAIAAITFSGNTARYVSMSRPECPILGLSPAARARRRMALYRGVMPLAIPRLAGPEELARESARVTREMGLGAEGDLVVLVYGEPVGSGVKANTLRLARIGGSLEGGT
jgi:pyruvate kinase